MAVDQSVVYVCTNAAKATANAAMAAFYGDGVGAINIGVALSATGLEPATHWAGANMQDAAHATALKDWPTGLLPTPATAWATHGLDNVSALAAGAGMTISVMTGPDLDNLPMNNFNATIGALGLQRVVFET